MKILFALVLVLAVGLHQGCQANVLPFVQSISTVPANGDVNPYGLVFIPPHFGCSSLTPDDILVANFNNATNIQGTGTTISRLNSRNPAAVAATFFTSELPGLTGALGIIKSQGLVLVGNVPFNPAFNGSVGRGVIQVLDCKAKAVAILDKGFITDPWGLTIFEEKDRILLFVSNVIAGTVVRVNLSNPPNFKKAKFTIIGSGFLTRPDPAAFVVGPAGLAYDPIKDELFVAGEGDNKIFKISRAAKRKSSAGTGTVVFNDQNHLHGPLGLIFTKEGHLITANADSVNVDPNQPSTLVEFTRDGKFLAQFSIDPNNGGAFELAFGVIRSQNMKVLGALNDNQATLQLYSQGPAFFHKDNNKQKSNQRSNSRKGSNKK